MVAVALAAAGQELLPGAYAVLFVAAFRGYDVTYRQRLAGATVTRDPLRSAGWPVRVLAVAVVGLLVRADVLGAGPGVVVLALLAARLVRGGAPVQRPLVGGPVTGGRARVTGPPGHQPVPMRRPPKMPPRPLP